jgi:APA family basic amino acid/polyamine antiporter
MPEPGGLRRHLGLGDAVVVGVGSMVGAGVFVAWAPAAEAAGTGLLIGLLLAGAVAFCNATSSAQLAARHPESGGSYVYARERLGAGWGHLAGWGFVVGKTASCAAMALTVGAYLWPEQKTLVGVMAVAGILAVNLGGLERTVAVTKVLVGLAGLGLLAVVVSGWSSGSASWDRIVPLDLDPGGILRSAGFLFFAFAGYARIATLGEEVRDPATTIPRAIPRALLLVLVLYAVIAVTALAVVPVTALAITDAPLRLVTDAGRWPALAAVVRGGAGIAALGVLLNLIPGISRTVLAMSRRHEFPVWFAHVDGRRSLPIRAEVAVSAAVLALVVILELGSAIAVSGVAVLTYYAITNAAALRLRPEERRWPRLLAILGLIGCVALAGALPLRIVASGVAALLVGVLVPLATLRFGRGG